MVVRGRWDLAKCLQWSGQRKVPSPFCPLQDGCENQSVKRVCSPPLLPWKKKYILSKKGKVIGTMGQKQNQNLWKILVFEPWQLPHKQYSMEAPDAKSTDINDFFYTEWCQIPAFFCFWGAVENIGLVFNYFYSYYSFLTHFSLWKTL